jgi:ribosomal-protein-alanine N-acetyltransferase
MSGAPPDPVDRIMDVMQVAFDPDWGEAWNRRQVSDTLLLGNCHCLLVGEDLQPPDGTEPAAGFLLSRQAADEEELLLVAVRPELRRRGIATALIEDFAALAKARGVRRLFLEMREGNPARSLYLELGFMPVGRRVNYYNRGKIKGIDAITFARDIG